jgi:hypothetical protein
METNVKQDTETNDIVLKSARGILIFSKWISVFAIGAITLGLVTLPFTYQSLRAEMSTVLVNTPSPEAAGILALILMMGIMILLLTLFAVNRLRRLVDSVGDGSPFTRINGTRLRGIGLAAFAIQVVSFVGSLLGEGLLTMLGETKPGQDLNISIDASISLSGILLVLLLIILARVFDRGAEMREELEGTI